MVVEVFAQIDWHPQYLAVFLGTIAFETVAVGENLPSKKPGPEVNPEPSENSYELLEEIDNEKLWREATIPDNSGYPFGFGFSLGFDDEGDAAAAPVVPPPPVGARVPARPQTGRRTIPTPPRCSTLLEDGSINPEAHPWAKQLREDIEALLSTSAGETVR